MEESTISAELWNLYDMFEPVPDFSAPTLEQIDRMCRWIEDQIENWERPVVVTCYAGIGRTGTVLAAYMVYMGYEPQTAIDLFASSVRVLSRLPTRNDRSSPMPSTAIAPAAPGSGPVRDRLAIREPLNKSLPPLTGKVRMGVKGKLSTLGCAVPK